MERIVSRPLDFHDVENWKESAVIGRCAGFQIVL